MRKKTIEEELREIAEEKEDHIEQLEKQFGHSDAHRYDFSPQAGKKAKKTFKSKKTDAFTNEILNNLNDTSFTSKNNTSSFAKTDNPENKFTYDDYKRMIQLEESELSDEEFDEYCSLMDRFAEAPNKAEICAQKEEEESSNQKSGNSITEKENWLKDAKNERQKSKIDAIEDLILEAEAETEDITPEEYDKLQKFNLNDKYKDSNIAEFSRLVQKYNNSVKHDTLFQMLARKKSAARKSHSGKSSGTGSYIFPILFLCIFVVAGFCVTIFAGIIPMTKYSGFVEVTATVKEVANIYYDDDGDLHASMIVSFMFKGNADDEEMPYETSIKTRVSRVPEPGVSTLKIIVNPNNPLQIRDANSGNYIFPLIFGIVFAGFALFMQILLITQAVKSRK